MNLLFVCSENRLRSPTGEEVFSEYNEIEAIGCGTNIDAKRTVSQELVEWSDMVIVMEKHHRNKLNSKYKESLKSKKLICLDIPDEYERMDPILIRLIRNGVMRHMKIPLTKKS